MARRAHVGQRYGDEDYFEAHVEAVAKLCAPLGPLYEIAALLHDVVEDSNVALEEIEFQLGKRVADYVDLLTDPLGKNRKERKAAAYTRLAKTELKVPLVVKAADRLANLRACVRTQNKGLLQMYRREHAAFEAAVQRSGLVEDWWVEMRQLLDRG